MAIGAAIGSIGAAIAGATSTGLQVAQGIEQARMARDQRRKEAALQARATEMEEVASGNEKRKRKAIDMQAQRDAAISASRDRATISDGSLLGGTSGGSTTLGGR